MPLHYFPYRRKMHITVRTYLSKIMTVAVGTHGDKIYPAFIIMPFRPKLMPVTHIDTLTT